MPFARSLAPLLYPNYYSSFARTTLRNVQLYMLSLSFSLSNPSPSNPLSLSLTVLQQGKIYVYTHTHTHTHIHTHTINVFFFSFKLTNVGAREKSICCPTSAYSSQCCLPFSLSRPCAAGAGIGFQPKTQRHLPLTAMRALSPSSWCGIPYHTQPWDLAFELEAYFPLTRASPRA